MKKFFALGLTLLVFCSCGEHEVKRMIIEPHPPSKVENATSCHLHFAKNASLKEAAIQAAQISDECSFNEEEFRKFTEFELAKQKSRAATTDSEK